MPSLLHFERYPFRYIYSISNASGPLLEVVMRGIGGENYKVLLHFLDFYMKEHSRLTIEAPKYSGAIRQDLI